MSRSILVCAFVCVPFICISTVAVPALGAQQNSQSNQYEGTSNPPPNDQIISNLPPDAQPALEQKPSPAHPASTPPAESAPVLSQDQPPARNLNQARRPAQASSALAAPEDGTDDGVVQIAPVEPAQVGLNQRAASDPDGDIVHPAPLAPTNLAKAP